MERITRLEAIAKGLTRYFTGKPCKHGHLTERRTHDRKCLGCKQSYRAKNFTRIKKSFRRTHLLRKFGMSVEEYEAILIRQDGGCAICGKKEWRALAVDHSHKTGKVRSLLCSTCNKNLGIYEKNRGKFAAYLEEYGE